MTEIPVLTAVGMILLYTPPAIMYYMRETIGGLKIFRNDSLILIASSALAAMMVILLPAAAGAFIFYWFAFHIVRIAYYETFLDKYESFSVAIYTCFAISVLWEWPIQLVVPQNGMALALSLFKALGIVFLVLTLRDRGLFDMKYHERSVLIVLLGLTVMMGLFLTIGITFVGTVRMYWMLHAYRLYWFALIMYLFGVTNINRRKLSPKSLQRS